MFCVTCGKKLGSGQKFCTSCGAAINPGASEKGTHEILFTERQKPAFFVSGIVILLAISLFIAHWTKRESSTEIPEDNIRSVVNIICDDSSGGSGTIISSEGRILTNHHVIDQANYCLVTLPDPETGKAVNVYHAKPMVVPALSERYDIGFLEIDDSYTDSEGETWGEFPTSFPAFETPDTCDLETPSKLGDSVKVYGYPVTSGGYNLTITEGVISSFRDDETILTSAKIDSGNSGGLAIDQNGCFIGIPSAVAAGEHQNLGVIISNTIINEFTDRSASQPLVQVVPPTNDEVCQESYGLNSSWSGELNEDGDPTCGCREGYSWDGSGDACESKTVLQRQCKDQYGPGSYSVTSNGKAICECSSGYVWDAGQVVCVPEKTNDQICQESYGTFSSWNGERNNQGGLVCDCDYGYSWNVARDTCVSKYSLDQACRQKYGSSSYYLGYVSEGQYMCN